MQSRTEDCIVMLPTHSRTGSFKMLSLATGKIVTRDQFKILPIPQSVIATLNAMAVKEGKKITQTQLHVFDELLFTNSLDKSKMPSFITNPPPLRMPLSNGYRWITNPHSPTYHQLTAFSRFLLPMWGGGVGTSRSRSYAAIRGNRN